MKKYLKYFYLAFCIGYSQLSYSWFCENNNFIASDYADLWPIKGYIVDRDYLHLVKKRLTKDYCLNKKKCSIDEVDTELFYRLYTLVEEDASVFITESYSNKFDVGDIVDIAEVSFPNLKVGEEYLLFIGAYDESLGLYDYHSCAVVPISEEVNKETYFFNEPPNEILSILENESLDFQR